MDIKGYDALIMITPADFQRLRVHHRRMVELMPARRVYFVGSLAVGKLLGEEAQDGVFKDIEDRVGFINENDILRYDDVKALWENLKEEYKVDQTKKAVPVGWYYQQFLKFAYARFCDDDYYLVWDGDTVPCRSFSMFDNSGKPCLDYKRECFEEYFVTIRNLLGMGKLIQPSFVSEHMLFKCDVVKDLLDEITNNKNIKGSVWWEKILYTVRPEKLFDNSFSEFETYGTYVAAKEPDAYRLREWHSLRYAALFYEVDELTDRDWAWLGRDFFAVSFEKNMHVRDDTRGLFNNPRYQEKLSARQVLEIAQEEFEKEALKEVWDIP